MAIINNHPDMARFLIDKGANINAKTVRPTWCLRRGWNGHGYRTELLQRRKIAAMLISLRCS
jgi:hypothetical protein